MSDTVIKVENVSKKYILRHQSQERYTALRDVMANGVKRIGKKLLSPLISYNSHFKDSHEDFFALDDVSFELNRGDRVGIIGRNGAGKSTLLKILSRITEPTSGRIEILGRVASLLEVGTGFHPELTGRENIFLNGAILGMGKTEIKRKFDEIVAFAEIEKFLDTPVKRYSSGMYVRLAFAVAAHLEPEILIVDEVLAVGDAQFQKKCLGKMQDVGKTGTTVLFVSHNMAAIDHLCTEAIYLEKGKVKSHGSVAAQIDRYLDGSDRAARAVLKTSLQIGSLLEIKSFAFSPNPVESGHPVEFSLELWSPQACRINAVAILIYSQLNVRVGIIDIRTEKSYDLDGSRSLLVTGKVHELPLVDGEYSIGVYLKNSEKDINLLDILHLFITTRSSNKEVVPYPPSARGLIEFNSSFSLRYSEHKEVTRSS